MATTDRAGAATARTARPRNALYSALIGIVTLLVLLQALWAGLFIREGHDYRANWVHVHQIGADTAIVLTLVAAVVAFVKLRSRRDLLVGTVAMFVLLVLEGYLGGLIGGHQGATTIHIPLGMALMALAVWLPMRATRP